MRFRPHLRGTIAATALQAVLITAAAALAFVPEAAAQKRRFLLKGNVLNLPAKEAKASVEYRFNPGGETGPLGLELEGARIYPSPLKFMFRALYAPDDGALSSAFGGWLESAGWHAGLYVASPLPGGGRWFGPGANYLRAGIFAQTTTLTTEINYGDGRFLTAQARRTLGFKLTWHFPDHVGRLGALEQYIGFSLRATGLDNTVWSETAGGYYEEYRLLFYPALHLGIRFSLAFKSYTPPGQGEP